MNLNSILKSLQDLLETNATGVKVYQESHVSNQADRVGGYLAWSYSPDYFQQCSEFYTGSTEGDLDVISYASGRTNRNTLYTDVLDVMMPVTDGKRVPIGPVQLTEGVYLHFVRLDDVDEVFTEKSGHATTETPGILTTFRVKMTV